MKILNFGSCNIDFVYSLHHIVALGETQTTHKLETFPGGKGLNQSIALSRAGAEVFHAGCIGEDGQMLRDILENSGVNTFYLKTVEGKNGHAIIQVNNEGDNSIFLYPGSNEKITKEYIDEVLSDFNEGDIILLQNEISHVGYIVKKAHEKGMCIVLNPSPFNEKMKDIDISMLSYVILNEIEAKQMTGSSDPDEAMKIFHTEYPDLKVMLTLGSRGCVYSDKEQTIPHPAFEVEAVDTTAAGDTFTGYFVAGIAQNADKKQVLRTASAASALSVTKNGAAPSIPMASDVLKALNTLRAKQKNKSEKVYDKIVSYIENDLVSADVDGLSRVLGYSRVYTGKVVREITGKTFSELLKEKRCERAAQLLISTELPISKIISEAGYANETFFRKMFKEKYGKKPLEYRKSRG